MLYDLIVMGAGPGGYAAAICAAQIGKKVLIIEKESLGGVCLNWGCIPTKSMLKSAEIAETMKNAESFGFDNISFDINFKKVVQKSRKAATKLSSGIDYLMKKNKIEVVKGFARIKDPQTIIVNDDNEYKTKNIIVATGARPRLIDGFIPDSKQFLTSKEALANENLPKNIIIIGSGAIGIEFASIYNAFGSKVTVIEMQDRILPAEDREISELAKKTFTKKGINFITGATVKKHEKSGDKIKAYIEKDKTVEYECDAILLAIGVISNTENIGIIENGIEMEKNHIKVNGFMQTNIDNIYAIGDVVHGPWLAHKASHEAAVCVDHMFGKNPHKIDPESIPGCTYSLPQIASVGLTEESAKAKGHKLKIGRFPYSANGKAVVMDASDGLIKLIFDADSKQFLGAHMFGKDVTEMIHSCIVAKNLETTEQELMQTIFPHPTLSEMLHEATLDSYDKAIHI